MQRSAVFLSAVLLWLGSPWSVAAFEKGTQQKPDATELKPGDYTWNPEAVPAGVVSIVVSLGAQQLWVYRDGTLIGRSTISSGRPGFETPKGVYMILQKNVTHHSNKYHEASMPFMERLTWGGLAIHAGNTPGHPESHGCMHVPEDFAKKLYGLAGEGDSVLVADASAKPAPVAGVNGLFADGPKPKPTPAPPPGSPPPFVWKPEVVTNGPYLIVFSAVDKRVYAYRKGVEIGRADLGGAEPGQVKGKHLYVALGKTSAPGKPAWTRLGGSDGESAPRFARLAKRWQLPTEFREKLRGIVAPGTALVVTDEAADNAKPPDADKED